MKNFIVILFLSLEASLVCGYKDEKCCKPGQSIEERNSTFICARSRTKRIQSSFENNDFFNKNISGSCIELYSRNKTAIFSVNVSTKIISLKEDINVKYFHKCCPLGQKYNSIIHSCTITDNRDDQGVILNDDSLVKIGLPQCKIISDEFFASSGDLKKYDDGIILSTGRSIPIGNFCVDSTLQGDYVVRKCEENHQICEKVRCIHKCCPDGQSFVNGSNCFDTFEYGVDLHSTDKIHEPDAPFVIIHGIRKPIYLLHTAQYNISVDKTGVFSVHGEELHLHYPVMQDQYCMEHTRKLPLNGYFLFSTISEPEIPMKFVVSRWAKVVSCICLLLTILVYLIVPKLRNLFGYILLSYSVATFLMFFSLSFSQLFVEWFNDIECRIMGFLTVLVVVWSFTWLHIMCIDIWLSLRTPRNRVGPLQKNEIKLLVKYNFLGWGFPIIWTTIIALLSQSESIPHAIRPYVGEMKCFLENSDTRRGNYAFILFIVLPLSVQQIINMILFVKIIMYYFQIEKINDGRLRSDSKVNKERFIMIVKLTVIMGVSFFFETVSSIFDFSSNTITEYIEVVWDTVNCLQGVLVFVIFICKKKVYHYICEVVPFLESRKRSSVPSSSTQHISLQQVEES